MATITDQPGVIGRVIAGSARNPLIAILLVVGLGAWGWMSLSRAPLDAIPDLSDAQVIIFTQWMGRSPDLVEDQITYPISSSLVAAPGVKYVRGQSMFGMSFVYVIFDDGTDIYWARSRVLEYLNQVQAQLSGGRDAVARAGCDRRRLGVRVRARRSIGQARRAAAAIAPGLEPAIRAVEREGRGRGRIGRRRREAIPGHRRSAEAARAQGADPMTW